MSKDTASDGKDRRAERLKEALRANLAKRKAQARSRSTGSDRQADNEAPAPDSSQD